MSTNLTIVSGEASETDSEEEIILPKLSPAGLGTTIQGEAIAGEDSESETDNDKTVMSEAAPPLSPKSSQTSQNESLLTKKLRENNRNIHNDLESYIQSTINAATNKLNSVEQHLLKSQLILQGAMNAIRSLNHNSSGMKNKMTDVLSGKFLNNVNVNVK